MTLQCLPSSNSQTETYCRGIGKTLSDKELKKLLIKSNFNLTKTLINADLFPGGYNWQRITKLAKSILVPE